MARNVSTGRKLITTVVAWTIGILIFFPILWTFLTSFKTEAQAIASPPVFLFLTGRPRTIPRCRAGRIT